MVHELNDSEKAAVIIFGTLVNNNISNSKIVDYMNSTAQKHSGNEINWLKVALQIDSKKLVDSIFSNIKVTETMANEAVSYASKLINAPKISTVDKIATKMVEAQYSFKHAQQSPDSIAAASKRTYDSLSTLEYLTEKVVDFFKKKTHVKNKISDLRETFLSNNTNNSKLTV